MDKSDWKGDAPLFSRLEVLETLDAQSRVLKGTVLPSGAVHTVSPRSICTIQYDPRANQGICESSEKVHLCFNRQGKAMLKQASDSQIFALQNAPASMSAWRCRP